VSLDYSPTQIHVVTVTIGTTTFDSVLYDAEADVLYLHCSKYPSAPSSTSRASVVTTADSNPVS
jgi:hypothetical protein